MAIDITSASAVATNVAINKVATQNQGDQREIQKVDQSSSNGSKNDRVSLTAAAERLLQTERSSERQPVVDTKRVEAIRGQIINGNYHINESRVSDKLLNFEFSLNGASRTR